MDQSMIIGLALAGLIVVLNGDKSKAKKKSDAKPSGTEFVVRVKDGNVAVGPKS